MAAKWRPNTMELECCSLCTHLEHFVSMLSLSKSCKLCNWCCFFRPRSHRTQNTLHNAPRKWDTLFQMGVHTSSIKGFTPKFARKCASASCVNWGTEAQSTLDARANPLMLLLCIVDTPIHNNRFHLLAFAPARPVWAGPYNSNVRTKRFPNALMFSW